MVSRSRLAALSGAAVVLAALAACAPADEKSPSTGASSGALACPLGQAKTLKPGILTIGTDNPAYEPWFVNNKPSNGKGFESAVAYQVAERLGYQVPDVIWVPVTFNNAIAPGPKTFDFDINQFSITPERAKAVDFSSPYYLVRQAVITTKGSKIAGAKSIAELKSAKLGAQVGTTSYKAINEVIKPETPAQVYNNNDDAKAALENGQVDGIVVDVPTAFYMTSAELDNGVIVGQLPPQPGTPEEQFGLVLDLNSALTGCVSQAVDSLRADGTLAALEKEWLAGTGGAPELT
jgi:polar amino acid transport system substrate-binding protein